MATATPSDVKEVINTNLADSEITDSINLASEWNSSANSPGQQSTTDTKNIERYRAIINIRQHKERSVEMDSSGDSSATYEGDELEQARSELATWLTIAGEDATQASALLRDTDRYVGSTE